MGWKPVVARLLRTLLQRDHIHLSGKLRAGRVALCQYLAASVSGGLLQINVVACVVSSSQLT
jgi:hypothetical protein